MSGDFWRKLGVPWLRRPDLEAELDDELDFHLDMRVQELIAEGEEPEAARSRAEREFGDLAATRTRYVSQRSRQLRRTRLSGWAAELVQDIRFGARALRKRPGFTAMATVVLALGIGAPTTVFTLVDTVFFQRPAHVVAPDRLVRVFRSWGPGEGGGTLGNPDYLYYRDNVSTLSGLAAWGATGEAAYRIGGGDPGQLSVGHASDNYFDVLGVQPVLGRTFVAEENTAPGTHPVMVLSGEFWQQSLGGDPDVVGSAIALNGQPYTVIGVAPPGFTGVSLVESSPDAWVPIAMYASLRRLSGGDMAWWERELDSRDRWLDVIGRVADGVTIEAATDNIVALGEALAYDGKDPEEGAMVTPQFLYRPGQEASLRSLSRVLVGVVLIVLLIAAANVAVLLLSRTSTRHREIGIRTAMGAGRGRILRQLLAESILLGGLGGTLGIALAFVFSDLAGSLLPLPFDVRFTPEPGVVLGAALLTVVTSVLVGLAPALYALRGDVRSVIHETTSRAGTTRGRSTLVVSQVALSLVLVAGAVLFTRSFWSARTQDLGFTPNGVLIADVNLQSLGYDPDEGRAFIDDALTRLSALPGARTVSAANRAPFSGDWSTDIEAPAGGTPNRADNLITVGLNAVAPDYFEAMGVEIVAGRAIGPQDRPGAPLALVINETLAEHLWPGENAVGRIASFGRPEPYTVVGVARDATYYALGEEPWTQAYLSLGQAYQSRVSFLVATDGSAADLAPGTRATLRDLDPDLAFGRVTSIDALVEAQTARYEVTAVLVGLFSVIALILATAGLYGVVSFLVSQRTREIGVRMALGASRSTVAGQVVAGGMKLAGLGIAVGVLGSIALRGYTAGLLYGVEPTDPVPIAISCLALLAVTAFASMGPARNATRVDPVEAIRSE